MNQIRNTLIYRLIDKADKTTYEEINNSIETYYIDSDSNSKEIEEYAFDNIPELTKKMEQVFRTENSEFAQACAIEAFENIPNEEQIASEMCKEGIIPDFVYVF